MPFLISIKRCLTRHAYLKSLWSPDQNMWQSRVPDKRATSDKYRPSCFYSGIFFLYCLSRYGSGATSDTVSEQVLGEHTVVVCRWMGSSGLRCSVILGWQVNIACGCLGLGWVLLCSARPWLILPSLSSKGMKTHQPTLLRYLILLPYKNMHTTSHSHLIQELIQCKSFHRTPHHLKLYSV